MTAINTLNIPLFDNAADYFLESSYMDGDTGLRAVITGSCTRKGNAIDVALYRRTPESNWTVSWTQIKRRVSRNGVGFTDMGAVQERRMIAQLTEIGIINAA